MNRDDAISPIFQLIQAPIERTLLHHCKRPYGKVVRSLGLLIEVEGLQMPLNTICEILPPESGEHPRLVAQVVGFDGGTLQLMPLQAVQSIQSGSLVLPMRSREGGSFQWEFPIGTELIGRCIDGFGEPLDDLGGHPKSIRRTQNFSAPINPLTRSLIRTPLDVGVRALNSLHQIGKGQRVGIFSGSGVGKSTLLGLMAKHTNADVVVIGLIGERAREAQEFIQETLGPEGLKKAVVVIASADSSPLVKMQAAEYACLISEHFRSEGKDILLIMDSLTRYAMAAREVGLAIGEPPTTKGYPPSAFTKMNALIERAGNGANAQGSITAFYTVLSEGDDMQDPIADSARSILDGHIVLSRRLAEKGHYPPIEPTQSVSRVLSALVSDEYFKYIRRFKYLFNLYDNNQELINVGAYKQGSNPDLDIAIAVAPQMFDFLKQRTNAVTLEESMDSLVNIMSPTFKQ